MNRNKLIFYISTGILTAIMLLSVGMYFFNHAAIQQAYTSLGFPTYIIYPLAVVKLLGLIAIWSNKSGTLREWAYAGFVFNTLLAATAHMAVQDGGAGLALIALVMAVVSYFFNPNTLKN